MRRIGNLQQQEFVNVLKLLAESADLGHVKILPTVEDVDVAPLGIIEAMSEKAVDVLTNSAKQTCEIWP